MFLAAPKVRKPYSLASEGLPLSALWDSIRSPTCFSPRSGIGLPRLSSSYAELRETLVLNIGRPNWALIAASFDATAAIQAVVARWFSPFGRLSESF